MQTYRGEPREDEDPLKRAVRMLWKGFGRNADGETQSVWAKSLRPYESGLALWRVLREAVEIDEKIPSLSEILSRVRAVTDASAPAPNPSLTMAEKVRADRSAIMSMLWLHYEFGWRLEDFGGAGLAGMLAEAFGDRDRVMVALNAARASNARSDVRRWMQDQAAATPAPCDKALRKQLAG